MSEDTNISQRKTEHIETVLNEPVEPTVSSFSHYTLPYRALPEIDIASIDTSVSFLGKTLSFPFLISSMTGGPEKGGLINKHLAEGAERAQVALALGSMRVLLRKPESLASFDVRQYCPSIPLFGNMGLVQLNYGYGADDINRIVDLIHADGMFLHINPIQEAIQPEGNTDFSGLLSKLEAVIKKVSVPVLIKEVGTGIHPEIAKQLRDIGVEWIDVSGTGGTSWSAVENHRRNDSLGDPFDAVGIPTDQALIGARTIDGLHLIGGGGVRSGMDVAKAIMLGAKLATAAKPFLAPALENSEVVFDTLEIWKKQFRIAMFCTGVPDVTTLSKISLEKNG